MLFNLKFLKLKDLRKEINSWKRFCHELRIKNDTSGICIF